MKQYRIVTGSITYAMRGRDVLRRAGFHARVERLTSDLSDVGCGYTVVLSGDIRAAESILRGAGVKILKIREEN